MNQRMKRFRTSWLLYILWGVFVNILNVWLVTPLVEDLAFLGVIAVAVLTILWLISIPVGRRKRWIGFTLFALLLGEGLSSMWVHPSKSHIFVALVMFIAMLILTVWYTKTRTWVLLVSALAVLAMNLYLPLQDWPMLTHFQLVRSGQLDLNTKDMTALPFAVIPNSEGGQDVVTVTGYKPTKDELKQLISQANDSPNALGNVLAASQDEYRLVVLHEENGHLTMSDPTKAQLALVQPKQLLQTFFPFMTAKWKQQNGKITEYMVPSLDTDKATSLSLEAASYPVNMMALASQVNQSESREWNTLLQSINTPPKASGLRVVNGTLTGTIQGHAISVPVGPGSVVSGLGHFTSNGHQEVLLASANRLTVVDVSQGPGQVLSTYKGNSANPIPNDLVIGPLVKGGPDCIFVNSSPAYVLQLKDGKFDTKPVYTAPSPSFRFEAVIPAPNSGNPELITNDPSLVRNSPTRYLTSYTYRNGQLVRNWRVFRTNIVNVTPVQWSAGEPEDLLVGIYGTGKFDVLRPTSTPWIPIMVVLLVVSLAAGYIIRFRERKGKGEQHNA